MLYLYEGFPCFDSYDYMYENRRYHWFFLREGDTLNRVYYTDEQNRLHITEDLANVTRSRWEEMMRLHYFD